jgi:hypothetical protein
MEQRIVGAKSKRSNGLENLFALSWQDGRDLGRQAVGPMARYADLNHQAGPRRRT